MRRLAIVVAILAIASASARAGEPRPWLCRDKPVFSSTKPMTYRVRMAPRWQIFLMSFSAGAGHDGFDIAQSISHGPSGQIAAGRYFAVALRNAGGAWICPSAVDDKPSHDGTVADLCFGTDGDGCSVELIVTSGGSAPQP